MDVKKKFTILMAEDDMDDYHLLEDAINEIEADVDIRRVKDGGELIDYLLYRGDFEKKENAPRPDIIVLDLNMPKIDGREALVTIKSNPELKFIPIIVFTTSKETDDICRCYESGASSYISKPKSYNELLEIVDNLMKYWQYTVTLPGREACFQ